MTYQTKCLKAVVIVNTYCCVPVTDHAACWSVILTENVGDVILSTELFGC